MAKRSKATASYVYRSAEGRRAKSSMAMRRARRRSLKDARVYARSRADGKVQEDKSENPENRTD